MNDDERREEERQERMRRASRRTAWILAAIALGLYLAFFWVQMGH